LKVEPDSKLEYIDPNNKEMCLTTLFQISPMEEFETVLKYDYNKRNDIFEQFSANSIIEPGLFYEQSY